MKTTTLYRNPGGNIWQTGTTDQACIGVFVQSYVNGDMNVKTYSLKKQKSKKNYPATHVYFVPNEGVTLKQCEPGLKRGKEFFHYKDGILFGAKIELSRLGRFVELVEN